MLEEDKPDFYLTAAGEHRELKHPFACWIIKGQLSGPNGNDNMLVKIEPPIIGQSYGLGGNDIHYVLLAPRLEGYTLHPINAWPCHVYVARIVDESIRKTLKFSGDQVEMILWAAIYRTREDAENLAKRFS